MQIGTLSRRTSKIVLLAALYSFGPLFMMMTSPTTLPLMFLVVPFLWMFASLFATVWIICGFWQAAQVKRRRLLLSATSAALPVLLAVFQSIHQLTIRDVFLAVAIIVVTAFYLAKADFIQ